MIFTCPDGSQSVVTVSGADVAGCASGQGSFIVNAPPFDVSTIDMDTALSAFSAGFFLLGVPLSFVVGARLLLSMLRNRGQG